MTEISTAKLADGKYELRIVGTRRQINSLLFSHSDVDETVLNELITGNSGSFEGKIGDGIKKGIKKIKRGTDAIVRKTVGKDIRRPKQAINRVFKMYSYCVTFTNMTGPDDRAGADNVGRETIHVRGGMDLAKIRAAMAHGDANVKKVQRGPCSKYPRQGASLKRKRQISSK
jgi:hypothetical protein